MYEQVEKLKKNKSKIVVNSVIKNNSNVKPSFGFFANREKFIKQRKMKEMVMNNNSGGCIQRMWWSYIGGVWYPDSETVNATPTHAGSNGDRFDDGLDVEVLHEEEEVVYNEVSGTYGTIPADMVRTLVEDWGCNEDTLQTAVNRITSQQGRWNYVRRLNHASSELKLSGELRTADKRVFAGADNVFNEIGNALH